MSRSARPAVRIRALCMGLALTAAAAAASADTLTGIKPLAPQPDPAALKPGLAVTYYFNKFNDVAEILEWAKSHPGAAGAAIPMLNYDMGPGNVLTSDRDTGVGAAIEGLIHFAQAGEYELMMQSNDGVKLEIGGKLIHLDPGVHADRFSDPILLRVDVAGWYPLSLLYFEKQGTATLELYWLVPGAGDRLDFVPAKAFAHPQRSG